MPTWNKVQDSITIFLGIFLEAIPFILLGVILSAVIAVFVKPEAIAKLIPKNKLGGILFATGLGFLFPVCECGNIPVARRLIKKKVKPYIAITFLLSAPVINPVVFAATYIANTKNHRFKPFWNKNIASAELVFSPSSDAVLGFNPDLGYLLIPTEPVLDKVVEFGWLEHLKTYGFNKSGDKLIFATSNSVEGITNFITIFSRGNVRTQYFFNNNRDFIELINFIPNQNKLAYLRNINLSEYIIQIFDYQRQEVQNLSLPGKSLEFLDVSANGRYLIVESYNSVPGQNYGPTLRSKIESFNNKFEAASILIIDMQNMNYLTIPFKGRKPTFAN